MTKLTAGDVVTLIKAFPITLSDVDVGEDQQSQSSHQDEEPVGGIAALKPYMIMKKKREKVSSHTVNTWIQLFRDSAVEAVEQSLAGIPASQPLDEVDIGKVQSVLDSKSAIARANRPLFHKINPDHSSAVLKVAALVFGQLKQVIRQAASHQPDMAEAT